MKRLGTRVAVTLVAVAATAAALAGTASASPGALKILILESQCTPTPANTLRAQLLAKPEVAAVDFFDGAESTARAIGGLRPYDAVVATGACDWADASTAGDQLAAYQDAGRVVIGTLFSWEEGDPGDEFTLAGRWISGGYTPFLPTGSEAGGTVAFVPLGADPLLDGVGPLTASQHDTGLPLTPGARLLGVWSDGTPALALKGSALGVNAYLGEALSSPQYGGDFAQLIVNAANVLVPQPLTVTMSGSGHGRVTSPRPVGPGPYLRCGTMCATSFPYGSTVTLTAVRDGFSSEFVGWSGGGCSGVGPCTLTMNQATTVDARFEPRSLFVAPKRSFCIVPDLRGRRLKAARRALRKHHCRLGRIFPKRALRSGRIKAQHPKAGTLRVNHPTVNVTLPTKPKHRGRHRRHHR